MNFFFFLYTLTPNILNLTKNNTPTFDNVYLSNKIYEFGNKRWVIADSLETVFFLTDFIFSKNIDKLFAIIGKGKKKKRE